MNPHRLKAYILLVCATVIWGVAEPVIKYTLEGFPPLLFLTYRFFISTLVALIFFIVAGFHFPKEKKLRLELLLYGFVTSTLSLGLLFFGLDQTTVLDATLIILINPLLISFAGVYFLKEHITKREKTGMAIALAGTVLTVLEPFIQNGHSMTKFSGNILIFLYLLATTCGAVMAKRLLRKGINPLTLTNTSFIVGFTTLLPFAILKYTFADIVNTPPNYHLGVLFMSLLSGSLAYYLSNKAQKTIEIGEAAVFSYLYPVFAAPLAVLWLGEKITPVYIAGAVVIAIGVAIAEIKKKRVASSS